MPEQNHNVLTDDLKNGNARAASTRIQSCTAKRLSGQRRHDLRIGAQPDYVDPSLAHLNRVLMQPVPSAQMRRICEERRAQRDMKRAIKGNAAVATAGIITFGSEAAQMFGQLDDAAQDAAFRELAEAVADRLATTLHGLVVHLDETTIHAHYQLAAYNTFGDPLSQSTSPRVLSELQDLTAEIMARHCPGIERGRRYGDRIAAGADFRDTLHKTVHQLHNELPHDLAAKRAEVEKAEAEAAAARERQAKNERLAEAARLKLAEAVQADQGRAEKAAKNLAIYERRAQEAQNAVAEAESRRSALCADIECLSGQAGTVKAELEAMAAQKEAMAVERAELEAERKAIAAEKEAMLAERAANLDQAKAWVERIKAERADLVIERTHLAAERAKLEADQAKLAAERAQVGGLLQRLGAMVERVEVVLEAALRLGPRVRRILGDAEAAANERKSAREARSEIVRSVPPLPVARSFLTEARLATQGEAQSALEQTGEQRALDWRISLDDFDGPG